MDFLGWWSETVTKSKEGLAECFSSTLNNLTMPQSCLQAESCSVSCGTAVMHLTVDPERAGRGLYFERKAARVVKPGLREDEEDFAVPRGAIREESVSNLSPAADEREVRTPADLGPPTFDESPVGGEGRTVTASSDIESVRTNDECIPTSVQDSCSAMHMMQNTASFDRRRCDESSQTTFRHGTKQADSWVKESVLAPTHPSYCCLGETSMGTSTCIDTFSALLTYLENVNSERSVTLRPLSHICKGGIFSKDVSRGDIVYIEKGTAGVGRNQKNLSTVVVSAQNTARKSTMRKAQDFCNESVPADCRLWELLYPYDDQIAFVTKRRTSLTWATPDKNRQDKPRRCWGVWELNLDPLRIGGATKKNCVACYLNCYLIIFALRTCLVGESARIHDADAIADLEGLLKGPKEQSHDIENKPKLTPFPVQTDSGAVCATLTTSASEEASPLTPDSTKDPSIEDQLRQLTDEVNGYDLQKLERNLTGWPNAPSVNAIWKAYSLFVRLTSFGTTNADLSIDPLLYKMTVPISTCMARVEQLLAAESVDQFIQQHPKVACFRGSLEPLRRNSPFVHRMVKELKDSSSKNTPQE